MIKTSCCLTLGIACLSGSAQASEAAANAYAEILWDTLSISFSPDNSAKPDGDQYLEWVEGSQYSASAIDMAWWQNDSEDGGFFEDHAGPEPGDEGYWDEGNGWGIGDVGHDLGPASGQAATEDSLSAQAHIVLTTPSSHAESLSAAAQGGLLATSEAGVLHITLRYYLSADAYATGGADAWGQAQAEFTLFNHSQENSPMVLDTLLTSASVTGGGSDFPDPLTDDWEGFIHLGAGDQAAFEGFVFALAMGDTPGETIPAEPGTIALMGAGVALLTGRAWRRRRRRL